MKINRWLPLYAQMAATFSFYPPRNYALWYENFFTYFVNLASSPTVKNEKWALYFSRSESAHFVQRPQHDSLMPEYKHCRGWQIWGWLLHIVRRRYSILIGTINSLTTHILEQYTVTVGICMQVLYVYIVVAIVTINVQQILNYLFSNSSKQMDKA